MGNFDKFLNDDEIIKQLDFSHLDLENNYKLLNNSANNSAEIKTINWLVPDFKHVLYGGIYTILRFADYFQSNKDIQNRIIIYGFKKNFCANIEKKKEEITDKFPGLAKAEFISYNAYNGKVDELPACDAIISTLWNSCYISLKFNKTKKKFYFIQDYEAMFSAAGSRNSIYVDLTYSLGFDGIVNSPGLADFLRENYDIKCAFFNPAIDRKNYYITKNDLKNKLSKYNFFNIVFYGRPGNDRNGFELGIASLLKVKEKYGDRVSIFSVGDEWNEKDYGLAGKIKNLGRLSSFKDIADLYRRSDIGLSFMFTKHPSYQPFEYMATGCAVVANFNKANEWLLEDGNNCLVTKPTSTCIAEKISELIEDNALRERIVTNALETVDEYDWTEECEKIFNYINSGARKSSKKIAIYTAIFGDKDSIKEPLHKIEQADLICFTDNLRLKSRNFDIRAVNPIFEDPTRNARMYKVLSHKYLPDYEYSIWIDGSVLLKTKDVESLIQKYLSEHDLAAFIHPERNCIYQEARACIKLKKENREILIKQAEAYRNEGYPVGNGLIMTGILFRKHSPKMEKINEYWWEEISKHSKRDQMSFNYVAWKNNFDYNVIKENGYSNDYLEVMPHTIRETISSFREITVLKDLKISRLEEIILRQKEEIDSRRSHGLLKLQIWLLRKRFRRIKGIKISREDIEEILQKIHITLKRDGAMHLAKHFLKFLTNGRGYFRSKEYQNLKIRKTTHKK